MSTHRIVCIVLALILGPAAGYALYAFIAPQAKEGSLRYATALGPDTPVFAGIALAVMVMILVASLRPLKK